MVSGMFMTAGQDVFGKAKTIPEFENIMKKVAQASKTYYRQPQATAKKVVVHNPEKNPFAPLYRPDREVLFRQDGYHYAPPQVIGVEKPVKQYRYASDGATIPPSNDGPSNFNKNIKKDVQNSLKDYDINNNTFKK